MLQYDIEALFEKYSENGDSYFLEDPEEVVKLQSKLRILIKRHVDTQKVAGMFLDLFGAMIFVHCVTCAITVCSVCVVILVVSVFIWAGDMH